ncbi:seed maturation protein pm25-like protein, partial [Colletotrichum musicola]
MSSLLPNKNELREQAVEGRPITQTEASTIASAESELTGLGPIKGGSAATAQSLHDKQQNFVAKAGDVARKPANEITKEDGAQVQSAE